MASKDSEPMPLRGAAAALFVVVALSQTRSGRAMRPQARHGRLSWPVPELTLRMLLMRNNCHILTSH
jgi:hypothetical protein